MERLERFIGLHKHPVRKIVIDARAIPSVDYTSMEKLRPFIKKLRKKGIIVVIARAHLPLREMKLDIGLEPLFSRKDTFVRVSDAVKGYASSIEVASERTEQNPIQS